MMTLHQQLRAPLPRLPLLRGLLLSGMIAAGVIPLIQIPLVARLGLGTLTLSILAGIITGNLLPATVHVRCEQGIAFSKHYLLRLGIILYGFNLTFQQIGHIGYRGLVTDMIMLSSTFLVTCLAGLYWIKPDKQTVWLIGAGSSICGAAAVLATAPVIRADAGKVAVAVATVVIFGTAAIFIYPLIWELIHPWLPGLSAEQFGIYTGSTVHEVAQVVAAGHAISPQAEDTAVIAKMLRVMMLAPFLLLLGQWVNRTRQPAENAGPGKITFPWFALIFILVAVVNSFGLLSDTWLSWIRRSDNILLAMAMAALGLSTRLSQLKTAGLKPLLLGAVVFLWLIIGGAGVNLLVWHVMQ